jgi:hypothetical protein
MNTKPKNRRGRPKLPNPYRVLLRLRITQDDHDALLKRARDRDLGDGRGDGLSALVRELVRNGLGQ